MLHLPRVFRPSDPSPSTGKYEIRSYRPGDEASILKTFNRTFRGNETGLAPRTRDEWRWEFLDRPGGARIWLAFENGAVVAQSAGIGYRASFEGDECFISQSVDSMVNPNHGAGLKNPGLFARTVEGYIEAYAGTKDTVFFGWPNKSAWRLGKRLLGYELVREQEFLARKVPSGTRKVPSSAGAHPSEVESIVQFGSDVRLLWARCAKEWGASVVRDEAFLNWRFSNHPRHDYDAFGVRDATGQLLAYAVGRVSDWPVDGAYMIVDWLVPSDEPELGETMIRAALERARVRGGQALGALLPEWSPWYAQFETMGFEATRQQCLLTARSHDERYNVQWLRDNWWYQMAESDYV